LEFLLFASLYLTIGLVLRRARWWGREPAPSPVYLEAMARTWLWPLLFIRVVVWLLAPLLKWRIRRRLAGQGHPPESIDDVLSDPDKWHRSIFRDEGR
jgi:hypothetical protein